MTKRKTPQKIDLTPRTLAFDPVKVDFDRSDRTPLCNATSKGRYTGPQAAYQRPGSDHSGIKSRGVSC